MYVHYYRCGNKIRLILPSVKTNSDSCGSRYRSAECFCKRLQHSHFTTLKVIVLRLASAKPDIVCGAVARASIIGVYQPFLLPEQYDRKVKLPEENKTIGIILCKDKNNVVVEMTLPEDNVQIFASKYETVLPKKEALQRLLTGQSL